jgi:hypothetical protein
LRTTQTINHTVCYEQVPNSIPAWIYEWPSFILFLVATMQKETLFCMRDALARPNVMAYRDGEALNWHFERSEFTTNILLQAPSRGRRLRLPQRPAFRHRY